MLSWDVFAGFMAFAVVDLTAYVLRMFRMAWQLPINDLLKG